MAVDVVSLNGMRFVDIDRAGTIMLDSVCECVRECGFEIEWAFLMSDK